jgi:protein TonB
MIIMLNISRSNVQKRALIGASLLILLAASCKNEEKKEDPTTTTTVTTDKTTTVNPDSTVATTTTTTTITGKPNPAKKGGKGKTVIVINKASTTETAPIVADNEGVYNRADVMPSYPGGEKALIKYLESNIEYPQAAIDDGVEGTVKLSFAVDENGRVYSPVLKSEKIGYGLEEEAIRIINSMPKWNPGNIKGRNVKTRFELPVTYVIN